MLNLSSIIIICILLFSCDKAPKTDLGKLIGTQFTNESVGVKFNIPENWSVILNQETLKLTAKEAKSDAILLDLWQEADAKTLVSAYRFKDSDFQIDSDIMINSNISLYVEYISERKNIKNAFDYIPHYKKALGEHKNMSYKFLDNRSIELNKFKFEIVDYEFDVISKHVRKRALLYKHGSYILNFTLTWEKEDELMFNLLMSSFMSLELKANI
jgi:hypothetical protein